ncbi:DEAD/DEAH box helicase [Acetobacter sp. AN02]|uniref:DEAD/DEAH box helicase n=1 Tax=Acetobacter sp. AN02 TaxID=2894186 RepID=UPI0038CF2E54
MQDDVAADEAEPEKTAPVRKRTRKTVAPAEAAEEVKTVKPARRRTTRKTAETEETAAEAKPVRKRATRKKADKDETAAAPAAEDITTEEAPVRRTRKAASSEETPAKRTTTRRKKAEPPEEAPQEENTPAPQTAHTGTEEPHIPGSLAGEVLPEAQTSPDAPAAAEEEARPLFADLGLSEPLLRAITDKGYVHPTPIQAQAIPHVLRGQDVLGVAQTGTGKTASFTLPMLEILSDSRARARMPRSLILEPTRELALQVAENFVDYGKHLKLTHALLIGGESMAEQKEVLSRGVDVLIATPGRLIDLFDRGGLLLTQTKTLVIDEADRMLDMGFIPDIERIVSLLPPNRQTLFFSATMAPEIRRLADAFLRMPVEITVSRPSTVARTIETGLLIVEERDKRRALRRMLRAPDMQNAIVFCNRKKDVDVLFRSLKKHGFAVGALHGDLPQSVRFATLEQFKSGELKILVCSDVAARGIDIGGEGLSHVFNFDLPFHAEDYVHRIGRTGRAGREGRALSLATPEDRGLAEAITKLTGEEIPLIHVDGVESRAWSEEESPRGGRDRKRRGRKGRDNRSDAQASPEAAPAETAPAPQDTRRKEPRRDGRNGGQRNERRDDRQDDRQDRRRDRDWRDSNTPADAPVTSVTGFGEDIPAFMNLPRREYRSLPADTADSSSDLA